MGVAIAFTHLRYYSSYVVAVNSIDNLTDLQAGSRILYGSGDAEFTLQYSAIVMKPFKGEVVDAIVDKVGKVSLDYRCLRHLLIDLSSDSSHISVRCRFSCQPL